jgi:hypothetical protein
MLLHATGEASGVVFKARHPSERWDPVTLPVVHQGIGFQRSLE